MPKGPDPRRAPAPASEVPRLLVAGAAEFNEGRFWHAHEAWEDAWHALRADARVEDAAYVRGLILVAAGLENALRGKESGFKRQTAEGLHALLGHAEAASALGHEEARAWRDAVVALYVEACRRRDWGFWNASGWRAPAIRLSR